MDNFADNPTFHAGKPSFAQLFHFFLMDFDEAVTAQEKQGSLTDGDIDGFGSIEATVKMAKASDGDTTVLTPALAQLRARAEAWPCCGTENKKVHHTTYMTYD